METIKKQLSESDKIVETYRDYYDRLDPLLAGQYTAEHEELEHALGKLPEFKKNVTNGFDASAHLFAGKFNGFEKDVRTIIKLYDAIQTYFRNIDLVFTIFDKNYLSADNLDLNDMSRTYKLETVDLLNDLRLIYIKFIKTRRAYEAALVDELSSMVLDVFVREHPQNTPVTILQSVEYIQQLFRHHRYTVNLYAAIMQKILNKSQQEKQRSVVNGLLQIIEDDKSFILAGQTTGIKSKEYASAHLTNPPLKSFGLLPACDAQPMSDLLFMAFSQRITGKISLQAVARKENIAFILMSRVTYAPIEYSLTRLINKDKATPLIQDVEYGVSKKIIERFNIIAQKENRTDRWAYDYKIVGDQKASNWYIVETVDGTNFRFLVPWVGSHSTVVSRDKIQGLLTYITESNKPSRATNYHNVCQQQATRNMFLRRPLSLDIMEENSREVDTQIMRNTLMIHVWRVIDADLKKRAVNNTADVNNIIHNQQIAEVFQQIILSLYATGAKLTQAREYTAGNFPFSELLSSYINTLQHITRRFMKELHDGYNRAPLQDEFELPSARRKEIITARLNDVLSRAISLVVSDKQNIYSSLNHKYLLLNFY